MPGTGPSPTGASPLPLPGLVLTLPLPSPTLTLVKPNQRKLTCLGQLGHWIWLPWAGPADIQDGTNMPYGAFATVLGWHKYWTQYPRALGLYPEAPTMCFPTYKHLEHFNGSNACWGRVSAMRTGAPQQKLQLNKPCGVLAVTKREHFLP